MEEKSFNGGATINVLMCVHGWKGLSVKGFWSKVFAIYCIKVDINIGRTVAQKQCRCIPFFENVILW